MVEQLVKTAELSDLFVESSPGAYIIGAQDGTFPSIGDHIEGKMGGIWLSAGRVVDDISHSIDGSGPGPADRFLRRPTYSSCVWGKAVNGVRIIRRQSAVDRAVLLEYRGEGHDKNLDGLQFSLEVEFDIIPEWSGDNQVRKDGTVQLTSVSWKHIEVEHEKIDLPVKLAVNIPYRDYEVLTEGRASGSSSSLRLRFKYSLSSLMEEGLLVEIKNAETGKEGGNSGTTFANGKKFSEITRATKKKTVFSDYCKLESTDRSLQRAFNWGKLNCEELRRNFSDSSRTPVCGGYPEFPWLFGVDSSFIIPVLLRTGQFEAARDTLLSLFDYATDGAPPHEVNIQGQIVNEANANESAILPRLLVEYFRFTRDEKTSRSLYSKLKNTAFDYFFNSSDIPFPKGFGIVEMPFMDQWMLDSVVEFIRGAKSCYRLARQFGDQETLEKYDKGFLKEQTDIFFELFWDSDAGRFADMAGKPSRLRESLDRVIRDNFSDDSGARAAALKSLRDNLDSIQSRVDGSKELTRWHFGHFIQIYPLLFGMVSNERANRVFSLLESDEFTGDQGLTHTARSSSLSKIPGGMYGPGNKGELVWALATGFLAEAEAKYGRIDQSYFFTKKIADSVDRDMPGALPELLPRGGCFMQGWSSYGIILPVIDHYFGIRNLLDGRISVSPNPPEKIDNMSISSVKMMGVKFDVEMENRESLFRFEINVDEHPRSGPLPWRFNWSPENVCLAGSYSPIVRRYKLKDHLVVEISENEKPHIEYR